MKKGENDGFRCREVGWSGMNWKFWKKKYVLVQDGNQVRKVQCSNCGESDKLNYYSPIIFECGNCGSVNFLVEPLYLKKGTLDEVTRPDNAKGDSS